MNTLSYISLFSSAGIGCYGFLVEGFDCIVTNELIPRRLDIQRFNNKCKSESGYIAGDITSKDVHDKILDEVHKWKLRKKANDIDVIIATPPCQGMSVANHKKTEHEIVRNSLVTESVKLIKSIRPRFFIFENVPAFLKTICTDTDGVDRPIRTAIQNNLGVEYSIFGRVINFKDYGACSSRSRTLVIGVRKDFADEISPIELFPDVQKERTLREAIGHLPSLREMGEISPDDIYHSFRPYPEYMRQWICDLPEGGSAFENVAPEKRPHQIINGEIVPNQQKNGDKYRRQIWDKVGPCVHTRNDQLASQNTIHPSDDRVFSIRELMTMMTIPKSFRWSSIPDPELNAMSNEEKFAYLKRNATNIRQSIGEAVPTSIFQAIARKIKRASEKKTLSAKGINEIISTKKLVEIESLIQYIVTNPDNLSLSTLSRIAELANQNRLKNAAYFTNKQLVAEVVCRLPEHSGKRIKILEPSVGVGNFLPLLFKKYELAEHVTLDVIDIDKEVLQVLRALMTHMLIPKNFTVSLINDDFLIHKFDEQYDLVVGNPPFSKLSPKTPQCKKYLAVAENKQTTNTVAFFFEKSIQISKYTALIAPKYLLNTAEFATTRNIISDNGIDFIIDFGEKGFEGVLVETVCIGINTLVSPSITYVKSVTRNIDLEQKQKYITDPIFPYWIIYRNDFFDSVACRLKFGIFSVFRDRQITNNMLNESGEIRVIKSRNISDCGTFIIDIAGYDSYIDEESAKRLAVYQYINRDDVYLVPNMTYYPRMMKKSKGNIVNGSVAILILKPGEPKLSKKDTSYFSSGEYRDFYMIARNYQTRSLNIDATSVFFFGRKTKGGITK